MLVLLLAILGTVLTAVGAFAPGLDARLAWAGVLLVEIAVVLIAHGGGL